MASPVAYGVEQLAVRPRVGARRPGRRSAAATSACGPWATPSMPSSRASRGSAWAPASSWKPPLFALVDLAHQRGAGHRQEADLAGAAGEAAVQPAADDEGGAEALLVPQQDEVLVAARGAEALLGDGDEVDVVLVLDGHRQHGGQLVEEGGGVPAGQVGGVAQPPGGRVEGAGRADDQPVHVGAGEPGGLHRPVERLGDLPHDAARRAGPGCGSSNSPTVRAGDVGDGGEDALRR